MRVAKRECLSKLVLRLEHDRIDNDAEDERDEEVLCDCSFQYHANPGVSPLKRRTERGVQRDGEVSFLIPRLYALRLWSVAIEARTIYSGWILDSDWHSMLGVSQVQQAWAIANSLQCVQETLCRERKQDPEN